MNNQMCLILKNTKDPHYLYKVPKLSTKIEGNGNGIKTDKYLSSSQIPRPITLLFDQIFFFQNKIY